LRDSRGGHRNDEEGTLSSSFKETNKMKKTRHALLAGTMLLPALAIPQWSAAAPLSVSSTEGTIIIAQAAPVDPREKEKEKAKQLQKGVPPAKGAEPPGQPQALPQQQILPPPGNAGRPKGPPAGAQGLQNVQPPQGQQNLQPPAGAAGLPKGPPAGMQGTVPPRIQQNLQPPPGAAGLPKGPPAGAQGLQNVPPQGQQQNLQPPAGAAGLPKGPPAGAQGLRTVPPQGQQQNLQPPAGAQGLQNVPPQGQQQSLQPPAGAAGLPKGPPAGAQGLQNVPPQGRQQNLQPPAAGLPKGPPPGPQNVQPLPGQPGQFSGAPQGQQALQQKQILQPQGIGTVDGLRSQRREHVEGKTVIIQEPGNRVIVRENGRAFIRHDETQRFRIWGGQPRIEHRGPEQYAYIARPGGYQIITVTDGSGRLVRRIRRGPDGREFVLIDNRPRVGVGAAVGAGFAAGVILGLAAPVITIPRERYIVDVSAAPPALLYETLEAPPVVEIERPYSLDEIRYNVALRDRMRRIDIDAITFDTGSWEVAPEQHPRLQAIAEAMNRILARNPNEMFMIEGHTDAVGNDVDNLSLSDRRAESVAVILTDAFQIPPENLVTQGYGEQHLKLPTDGPSRENRRVAARRITPLLQGQLASR
jgi:outer membrane protein OmpA-like peptidoglycan-associated protein